jgi:hypothetical protein
MGGLTSNFWFRDYLAKTGCTVKTAAGWVRGKTFVFENGQEVDAFLGVPYARNGIFQERFQVSSNSSKRLLDTFLKILLLVNKLI